MHAFHSGIILKISGSKKNRLALFDETQGRIEAIMAEPKSFFAGAIVSYRLVPRFGCVMMYDIQLMDAPLMIAHHDMLFMHHVLEIVFHFVPVASTAEGVYELLQHLFVRERVPLNRSYVQLFLFKLLTMIGMYPEVHVLSSQQIKTLHAIPIDRLRTAPIDLECSEALDQWLRHCIGFHPLVEQFNTLHFLMNQME